MNKLLMILFSMFFAVQVFAAGADSSCAVNGPSIYSYSASIDKKLTYMYDDPGRISAEHNLGIYVNDCKKAAGKFLMVGFGVNDFSLDAATSATVYSDDLAATKCSIKNSSLKNIMTYAERAAIHKNKSKFLEVCVETTLAHNSAKPLRYRANQIGCNIEKVSAQRVIIHPSISKLEDGREVKSNYCFFKVYGDSEFVVTHKIKEQCTDPEFLLANNIEPMEVNAGTTFGIVGKPNGKSSDLELLPSKITNFILEPSSEQLKLTEDFGRLSPQFPANFRMPDIEFGNIEISQYDESSEIKFPFLVDNRCEKQCSGELCTSPCNFSQPIVGEVTLYEIKGNKKEYIKSWYDGAVAPPMWQGFLGMQSQYLENITFEKGKKYRIEILFRDPRTDFTMYNKSTTPLFKPLPGVPTIDFAISLLNGIPTVAGTQNIEGVETIGAVADYGVIKDFGQYSGGDGIDGIQTLSKFTNWPPFYDKACGDKGCKNIGTKPYLEMNFSFIAGEVQNNKILIKNVNITKRSTVFSGFDIKVSKLPKVSCPWD